MLIPLPRLKQKREQALLTQGELADLARLDRDTVYVLESLKSHARPRTVRALAAALQCSPYDLMEAQP